MRIEFQHTFKATNQEVWDYLQNPDVLSKTLPGCRTFVNSGEDHFKVDMGLDVGPVKGMFAGTVDLLELSEPFRYRLVLKGSGKPGELEADAHVYLNESDFGTDVLCDAEANVTGIMASVGQRIMGGVARMLLSRFFKSVEAEIKKAATPT